MPLSNQHRGQQPCWVSNEPSVGVGALPDGLSPAHFLFLMTAESDYDTEVLPCYHVSAQIPVLHTPFMYLYHGRYDICTICTNRKTAVYMGAIFSILLRCCWLRTSPVRTPVPEFMGRY